MPDPGLQKFHTKKAFMHKYRIVCKKERKRRGGETIYLKIYRKKKYFEPSHKSLAELLFKEDPLINICIKSLIAGYGPIFQNKKTKKKLYLISCRKPSCVFLLHLSFLGLKIRSLSNLHKVKRKHSENDTTGSLVKPIPKMRFCLSGFCLVTLFN